MSAYAIYRLPHEDHATLIRQKEGDPVELHSLTELNGRQGFVVAPFEIKSGQPIVVIQGEASICHLEQPLCHLERSREISPRATLGRDDTLLNRQFQTMRLPLRTS